MTIYSEQEAKAILDKVIALSKADECTATLGGSIDGNIRYARNAVSTSGIVDWIHQHKPKKAMLVTECSMAANIADALPDVDFAKPCNMCPYMKKITLEKVLFSLHSMTTQVEVDAEVGAKARIAVERMIDLSRSLAR